MNNEKNYRTTYALTFSVRELIFFILSFSTIVLLATMLYLQKLQIHELMHNLNNLQTQISYIMDSFTVLENEKNVEILALKESVEILSTMSNVFDTEVIRAQTERRELIIRTSLILLGSVTFLFLGHLFINSLSTTTETPYKYIEYKGTLWRVDVTKSDADMQISVKIPGAEDFIDAMKLLDHFINPGNLDSTTNIIPIVRTNNLLDWLHGRSHILRQTDILNRAETDRILEEFLSTLPAAVEPVTNITSLIT